jgi:hypothetical protein
MQYQTLPATSKFTFDNIVPKTTSTRRVAAAAFYHCLGTWRILEPQQHCYPIRDSEPMTSLVHSIHPFDSTVLATKDLIRLEQREDYGAISLAIV